MSTHHLKLHNIQFSFRVFRLFLKVTKSGGLSCDGTHAPLHSEVPVDAPAAFVDLACENRFEPVETPTVRPLYHGLSANFPAFHTACCQKHAGAEGLYGIVHRRGGGTLKAEHPSLVATSFPSGGKGRCSAGVGEGVGGEMASKYLLLMTSSWPTTGVEKILWLTKDSKEERVKNDIEGCFKGADLCAVHVAAMSF